MLGKKSPVSHLPSTKTQSALSVPCSTHQRHLLALLPPLNAIFGYLLPSEEQKDTVAFLSPGSSFFLNSPATHIPDPPLFITKAITDLAWYTNHFRSVLTWVLKSQAPKSMFSHLNEWLDFSHLFILSGSRMCSTPLKNRAIYADS